MWFQGEAKLMGELQATLEKQYVDQLEKAQEQWKVAEIKRINDELLKQKEQLLKVSIILQVLLFKTHLKLWSIFCDAIRAALRCDSAQLFRVDNPIHCGSHNVMDKCWQNKHTIRCKNGDSSGGYSIVHPVKNRGKTLHV